MSRQVDVAPARRNQSVRQIDSLHHSMTKTLLRIALVFAGVLAFCPCLTVRVQQSLYWLGVNMRHWVETVFALRG